MNIETREPLLRAEKLTKKFGKLIANNEVTFEINPSEVHCFLGENGAGKSTLAECLYGYSQPDCGDIYFEGKKVAIKSPIDAIHLGIGMVHQHFILVRPLTVIENIVVGTDAAHTILDLKQATRRVQELCAEYDINIDLSAKIWQLSVAEQEWVEILKALFGGVKLLILDEPTAVLTPQESQKLFAIIRKMKQSGFAIILITHKLNEVMEISDRVTILRKGEKIATVKTADMNNAELARMMVGRDVVFTVNKPQVTIGEPVLEVKEVCARNDRGQEALRKLSLTVKSSEIVGIAGVSGNGQKELFETIIGMRHVDSGEILLSNTKITNDTTRSISSKGLAHIPEDRLKEGLVPDFTITENLMLGLHQDRFFKHHGWYLDSKEVDNFAQHSIEDFEIATPSAGQITRFLSGGNIQKVVIARELSREPVCLMANMPTRGLDVGAIEYVHNRLLDQCQKGTGILLFSDDLEEIMNMADRILVIYKGSIVGELDPKKTNLQEIGLLMAGSLGGDQ